MDLEQIGKYQLLEQIGEGAMGCVYRAHDPVLKRDLAIKTIRAAIQGDAGMAERFLREARSAARLNHANIVKIYDFGQEGELLYIAMELLKGFDLKDLIESGQLGSLHRRVDFLEQIMDGVGSAHAQGVVHRDLKPGNVHVQPNGRVKILDFGLARVAESEMTQAGTVLGTPNYMAPEQVRAQGADARSDVFALGVLCYEVLAGRRPFTGAGLSEILKSVLACDPQPLPELVPDLPDSISNVVERALRLDPNERFVDAGAMAEALRAARADLGEDAQDQWQVGPAAQDADPGSAPTMAFEADETIINGQTPSTYGSTALQPRSDPSRSLPSTLDGAAPTQIETPPAGSPLRAYGLGAAVVALLGVGIFALGRRGDDPAQTTGLAPGDIAKEQIGILSDTLVASQIELAQLELDNKDYQLAIDQAERALELDPANVAANDVVSRAREALRDLDAAASAARAAFDAGDTSGASAALGRVLALDPRHPVAGELTIALNEHFQSQAQEARAAVASARQAAEQADATSRADFSRSATLAQQGESSFARGEYAVATQRLLEARDGFGRARRQAVAARPTPPPTTLSPVPTPRPTPRPTAPPTTMAPTPPPATVATPVPLATPPPVAATPPPITLSPQEIAVRSIIDRYADAMESQDLELFKAVKPNLSKDDEKRLENAFKRINSQVVGIEFQDVSFAGTEATVVVKRQDTVNGIETPEVVQTFKLIQSGGDWVIESIGQ